MFKAIKNYEGIYEINELGEVRSVDRVVECKDGSVRRRKGKVLKPRMTQKGYAMVGLNKNGIVKKRYVHRLVAETFLPNPENLPEVHHKNHDPKDNRAENLAWVTRAEQRDEHWRAARGTRVRVVGNGIDKTFISAMAVQRELGINQSYVLQTAKGKSERAKGYQIYFVD